MRSRITDHCDTAFVHRLKELRAQVETVPYEFRQELQAFADVVQNNHEQMLKTCHWIDEMVADLGATLECTRRQPAVGQAESPSSSVTTGQNPE